MKKRRGYKTWKRRSSRGRKRGKSYRSYVVSRGGIRL